jgi:hypothetical protein
MVLGARYGEYIADEPVSFTEWGYKNSKNKRPVLAFLLNEHEFEKERQKVVSESPNEKEKDDALIRFRDELKKTRFCKFFSNTEAGIEELGRLCINSIHQIINEKRLGENAGWIRASSQGISTFLGSPNKKYTYDLFVLMPFALNLKPVYDDHITKVAKTLNLSIARADDFFSQNSIMYEVWSAITQASILIADCTGKNPNVFYEIGIAHTIGKPVILITQNQDDVPFDLRYIRYIQYDYTPPGMIKFENILTTTISEIRKDLGKGT